MWCNPGECWHRVTPDSCTSVYRARYMTNTESWEHKLDTANCHTMMRQFGNVALNNKPNNNW